jgi:hypothetical protein
VTPFLLLAAAAFSQTAEEFARMTPDQIRAVEIGVMEKIASLALIPPVLNTSPLPNYDYDQLDYGMTIGIARTPKGRIWAAWVAGEDGPKAFFVLAASDDDGATSIHDAVRRPLRRVGIDLRRPGRRQPRVVRPAPYLARLHAQQTHRARQRRMAAAGVVESRRIRSV